MVEDVLAKKFLSMPHTEHGMVVGLFGGSFNPPHEGHLLVAEIALRQLNLDQLWWMVTPGNPLKSQTELAPLAKRIVASEKLAKDPKIKVTAFEHALGSPYTAHTLSHVRKLRYGVHFIWIMGADGLKTFHRWQQWRAIVNTFPIAIIDRPGATLSFLSSRMTRSYGYARVDEDDAGILWRKQAPAWTFIHGPRSSLSSTSLRSETRS